MKKLLAFLLCLILTLGILPAGALADSAYSTISNFGYSLQYPADASYYGTPKRAEVKASKQNGSIYIMPMPENGHGVLGTVANGTEVTLLAEESGYCFFSTADGRMGWNGKKFFTVLGPAAGGGTQSLPAHVPGLGTTFRFDSGASISIPSGFTATETERDANNGYVNSYYTNPGQNMDLTLVEINTWQYAQTGEALMTNLYNAFKTDYPRPTYDAKERDWFALSGYSGSNIYYFESYLIDRVIYLVEMIYPTKNRAVCDAWVSQIMGSFRRPGTGLVIGPGYGSLPIPSDPLSPYGKAMRRYYLDGISYTDAEKTSVVTETYNTRKTSDGKHESWYTSATYNDPVTGYTIGFYYADGMLFFASPYHVGEHSAATFYFWGDQLLCVQERRGSKHPLAYAGSADYNALVREFGDLYAISQQVAPYRK